MNQVLNLNKEGSILVTGGAGFIGSNVVAALNDCGKDVVVCDTLRAGDKWRNLAKRELAGYVQPAKLLDYLNTSPNISAIVHMGAISATTEVDGDLVIRTNFELSLELWNWCTAYKVPYIYASSAATYGDGECGFYDTFSTQALSTLRPLNLYGWSKHLFDRRVARIVESNLDRPPQWAGLKFFNVYGPNEYHKGSMKSVVAHLYPKVIAGEPARLFKSYRPDIPDGGQQRDFVYVKDCVNVILWLLDNPSISGLFNVGSGIARSFHDLAFFTMKSAGLNPQIEFIDMPETLREKYQYFTEADLNNLRKAGYHQPLTSLEAGINDYIQRYLKADDKYH
jgi:ADP-L-glycero-D-manno-heptose 6-epimerase